MAGKKKLTPTQKAFVAAFHADPSNATEAYLKASPSVSRDQARNQAWKYLHEPKFSHVQAEIKRLQEKAEKEAEVSRGRLMQETAMIALYDPGGLFDEDGSLIEPRQLPEELRRTLKSIEVIEKVDPQGNTQTTYKYHFWDKVKCLELYSRFKGIHGTNVNLGNRDGRPLKHEHDHAHRLEKDDPVAALIDEMLGTGDEPDEDHEEPEEDS